MAPLTRKRVAPLACKLTLDNLKASRIVVSLSLNFTTMRLAYKLRVKAALCEIKKNDMKYQSINLNEKLGKFQEQWAPKVIAEMNDYQFKIVKLEGEFVWHSHAETDEAFLVIDGELRIDFRDGAVNLSKGEMYVVPRGIEHKPFAEKEVKLMLIEPRGVLNTGDAEQSEITAVNDVWV